MPAASTFSPPCNFCGAPLQHLFTDLGMHPLCERIIPAEHALEMEPFYPLRVLVCERCFLVQVPEVATAGEIFGEDYPYYSSYSDSWVDHARRFVEAATERLSLDASSFVVELASNDGYLLQWFVKRGIPCLGVEPVPALVVAAKEKNVPSIETFFGRATAEAMRRDHPSADLIVANNVLAHVPDINDFVGGIAQLLSPEGTVCVEFPHLIALIDGNEFDTIYHEHFSYLYLAVVERIFERHGLRVYDVEELATHGGSLRVWAQHAGTGRRVVEERVAARRRKEHEFGLDDLATYARFDPKVREVKYALLEFLLRQKQQGRSVVGYGAPGKGNTLLNYCGIKPDLLEYTVDRNPYKHGKLCPGSRIPIYPPDKIFETKPDYVLILPWNLKDEIARSMAGIAEWGGRFVVAVPELTVLGEEVR